VTSEGKTPKNLVEEMVPLLDSREIMQVTEIDYLNEMLIRFFFRNPNKVRIVALYIQHRDGVPDEDRRRLYQHARLTLAEQDAVNALAHMGIRIGRVSNRWEQ
jgi:syntaxin-binding protein 1